MNPDYEVWLAQGRIASLRPLTWPGHVDAWIASVEPWQRDTHAVPFTLDYEGCGLPPELPGWQEEYYQWIDGLRSTDDLTKPTTWPGNAIAKR